MDAIKNRKPLMRTAGSPSARSLIPLLCAALLAGCSAMGWGEKSTGGSTHTMTGGAEAAPTSEATPQPARPRGDTRGSTGTDSQEIPPGSAGGARSGATSEGSTGSSGDRTTGGAEAMPTEPDTTLPR